MTSTTPLRLPDGLADLAPGPELAAVLAGLPPARIAGRDLPTLLRAWARQQNHATGAVLQLVREAGLALEPDGCARAGTDDGHGPEEARVALVWSRATARARFRLGDDLVRRLPAVLLAMQAGRLDEPRARAFAEGTRGLEPDLTQEVLRRLLPIAPTLLLGALVHRIQQIVLALDPDWARRREERAEADRRVEATRTASGTADLCGRDLPLERVVTAAARIERLAATVKSRGVQLTIDQLRADMFAGLLDGLFEGLDDAAVVELVLEQYEDGPETEPGSGGPGDGPDGGPSDGPEDGPDDDGPRGGPDGGPPAGGDDAPDEASPGGDRGASAGGGSSDDPARATPGPVGEPVPPPPDVPEPLRPAARAGRGLHRSRGQVRAELSTLLGLDDRPGELCGWGPVHADRLRDLVRGHTSGEWTVVVTDAAGLPLLGDVLRRRPRDHPRGRGWLDVEIAVPAALLATLDGRRHRPWAAILAELRDRVDALAVDGPVPLLPESVRSVDDLRRRFARAATERAVRIRDRTCVFPACRAPALTAQLDHTVDHAHDGPTEECNLGALCAYHHALKTAGGWTLRQLRPGEFTWTSRAGATYRTGRRPVIADLPEPVARRDGRPRIVRESPVVHPEDRGVVGGWGSSLWTAGRDADGVRRVEAHPVPPLPADAPPPF